MGTPINPFSTKDISLAVSLARETARNFDQCTTRVAALERLRELLHPMVEWLDMPVGDWLKTNYPNGQKGFLPTRRFLPLFGGFSKLLPVGLTRNGSWVAISPDTGSVAFTSSEEIVAAISLGRFDILNYRREDMKDLESAADLRPVVEHGAFLVYLSSGITTVDKLLKEREERLRVMRSNLSFLQTFVEGADPLRYDRTAPLPGYAVFYRGDRGISRCSGTYLAREPVEEQVSTRNSASDTDARRYFVFDESHRSSDLENFLLRLRRLIDETHEGGMCGRKPFLDEEVALLRAYVGSFSSSIPDA